MARFGRAQPVPRHVIRPAAALAVRPADTGTGADADTYADAYADAYSGPVTGTGADALTPAAVALTLTETVTCDDEIAFLVAAVEQDDSGTGDDELGIVIAYTETGTGSDALTTGVTSFTLIENTTFTVTAITMVGGLAEITFSPFAQAVIPAGALAVQAVPTVAVQLTLPADSGTGSESLAGGSRPALADTGIGAEGVPPGYGDVYGDAYGASLAVVVPVPFVQAGTAADALAVAAAVSLADAGAGAARGWWSRSRWQPRPGPGLTRWRSRSPSLSPTRAPARTP